MYRQIISNALIDRVKNSNEELYRFIVSDEAINRNGWKTITAGIELEAYRKNPIVLLGHYGLPIGIAKDIFVANDKLYADIWYHEETEESRLTKKLIDIGVMMMTSIGIAVIEKGTPIKIPPSERDKYPPWIDVIDVFTRSELREISNVPIPANPGAKFVKKIKSAIADGILTSADIAVLQRFSESNLYIINNYPLIEEHKMPDINDELTKLKAELDVTRKENETLKTEVSNLGNTKTELMSQLAELKNEITQMKEAYKKETEEWKAINDCLKAQLIETQVEADLAKLKDKILPAENNNENNYKLKRDLIHLKANQHKLIDADGTPLYDIKIQELMNRESLNKLKDDLSILDKPIQVFDISTLDLNNAQHRPVIAEYIKDQANKNGTTFAQEYHKLLGGE